MANTSTTPSAEPTVVTRKAQCARCGGERNCEIHGDCVEKWEGNDACVWGETTWNLLKCCGCDYVFIETRYIFSENIESYNDEIGNVEVDYNEKYEYWPAFSHRKLPDWMDRHALEINHVDGLHDVILETYKALANNLLILAAIGVRTCFDVISCHLGVKSRLSFSKKLEILVKDKHISDQDLQNLKTAVEVGNAAVHRGWIPKATDLHTMMDVLETFISDTLVQPRRRAKLNEQAARVSESVPARCDRSAPSPGTQETTAAAPAEVLTNRERF